MADMASTARFPSRVLPLLPSEFSREQAEAVGAWTYLNFSRVLVRHPAMYRTFVPFLAALITETALPPRDREIVCLRMLRACDDVYEHTHHVDIARREGMTDAEIKAASAGQGDVLTDFDLVLIAATEELRRDQRVSDATWAALGERYSEQQQMELVFLAGCYETMAMLTRSFGIQLETSQEDLAKVNALRTYIAERAD
jgi:4-carboxymuconolactone decarboxylase